MQAVRERALRVMNVYVGDREHLLLTTRHAGRPVTLSARSARA